MMSLLAVLLGLAVGCGLALPLALRIRRRAQREAEAQGRSRPSMLGTVDQRRRILWITVSVAAVAVVALAAGAPGVGSPLLFLALVLTGQAILFGTIAQLREARSRVK
jgi:hypothetical protein